MTHPSEQEITELITEARDGDFEDRGWMIDVIERMADALEHKAAQVKGLGFALAGTQAENRRLESAIREALATAPKLGELRWRNVDRMIGVLRRALDETEEDS
jgi:hypothetical protein